MVRNNILSLSMTILVALVGCGHTAKKSTPANDAIITPLFDADTAYRFVEEQVAFGARVPNTPAQTRCAKWMEHTLKGYGAEITRQQVKVKRYDGKIIECINVIGTFDKEKSNRILLCAHWDSRFMADNDPLISNRTLPVMGANDGASGVAVLLEVARHLHQQPSNLGVDIVLFDAEDQGAPADYTGSNSDDSWCLGAQHWSKNPHVAGYRARFGILLDMVGGKNATFYRDQVSAHYAKSTQDKVWKAALSLGYNSHFFNLEGGAITDDHLYVNTLLGVPTIDIIDFDPRKENGFFEHWHTANDLLENIDRETLRKVGQTVMKVIYEEK